MQFGPPVNVWVMFYTNALFYLGVISGTEFWLRAFIVMCKASSISLSWRTQNSLFFFYLHITDEILQANSVGQHFGFRKCKVDGQEINGTHTVFQEAVNLLTFQQS